MTNKFMQRLDALQKAIDGGRCPHCVVPIEAESDEAFFAKWSTPCPACGEGRTWLDLAQLADEQLAEIAAWPDLKTEDVLQMTPDELLARADELLERGKQ